MPVYWSMMVVTLFLGFLGMILPKRKIYIEGQVIYRVKIGIVLIMAGYVVFFVGFRDSVLDTGAYIISFNGMPTTFKGILQYVSLIPTGKGFYMIEGIFKMLISKQYYAWLMFLALVSCGCLYSVLYKYSIDFPLSAYLFIAETSFTWLLNGTRQFLAVCILFIGAEIFLKKGKLWFVLLAFVLATIHTSAIFVAVIAFFISKDEIVPKKMILFIVLTVVGTIYSERVFMFLGSSLDKDYTDTLLSGTGSNYLRFLVSIVPLVIVFMRLKSVKKIAPPSICLAINMSLVGACFNFASIFTNGILVGRMPIYFTVYNLYLLPWVMKKCFTWHSYKIIKTLCLAFYLVFFYYQMEIAWGGLRYVSDFLKISFL